MGSWWNSRHLETLKRKTVLQFGHDFSAVETLVITFGVDSDYVLQFGHDFSAMETCP